MRFWRRLNGLGWTTAQFFGSERLLATTGSSGATERTAEASLLDRSDSRSASDADSGVFEAQWDPPGWVDALVVVGLLIGAFVARRSVLPHDGLFGDDAWQAFGAANASLSNFLTVGFSAPGFTAALTVWHRLFGAPEHMADLAFAAGVVSPAVLYVALRRFGYLWSTSLVLGAALGAEHLNVVYSGRVKSYVVDALIVLGFAALCPRLARVHFGWRAASLWIVGAFVVGSFSPFALIAAGVAGVFLCLHPVGDRAMRTFAVVVQAALYLVLTLALRRTYNVQALEHWWKTKYDGFIGFDVQPVALVSRIVVHVRRVAAVFSGGPVWWATLILIVALLALAADALVRRRSSRALRAQYLLLLVLAAVVASVARGLPLGPTSAGARLSLWLVPVFAIGIADALDRLRTALPHDRVFSIAFDVAAVIVAVALLASASNGGPAYPLSGSRSATEFVEGALGTNDVVFIENDGGMYPYAIASHLHVVVRPHPQGKVAFQPEIRDGRFHYLAFSGDLGNKLLLVAGSDTDIARILGRTGRIFLYVEALAALGPRGRIAFGTLLHRFRFTLHSDHRFGHAHVFIWQRAAA